MSAALRTDVEQLTLATAYSRVPDRRCSAAARLDPYWAGVWNPGSTAQWLSRTGAERMAEMGLGDLPAAFAERTASQALDEMVTKRDRATRLSALAAVGMWRTVTAEQLAAIVGRPSLGSRRSLDREILWATGLVDQGRFTNTMRYSSSVPLYRIERAGDFEALSGRINYADWVGVTGGGRWGWGSQYDRHNLLATELSLRVAEYTDIACVLGESMAGIKHLAEALGAKVNAGAARAADALFIRADGMLIAVEVTASVTANLREKIERWADVLASDRSKKLAVIFVECAHPDYASANNEVHNQLRRLVSNAANGSIAAALEGVPDRMMLARWSDWFPGAGRLGAPFLTLEAQRPSGPPRARWQKVNLLDPFSLEYEPADEAADAAMVAQCASLYGVPHWMRTQPPNYTAILRSKHGVLSVPRLPYWRDYSPSATRRA